MRFIGFVFAILNLTCAFPESDNPVTQEIPLQRPPTSSHKVILFEDALCSSWGLVLTANYTPPAETGPWTRVIMDFKATENGTQFDRYGALWIGDVEVLRTTTAEPTPAGIEWTIEKDLTLYSDYLSSAHMVSLSIPNNIDSTYTGIPSVSVSLSFYQADSQLGYPPFVGPTVLPLTASPGNWSNLGVSAGSNLSYEVQLTADDVVGVRLELLASAHGCEEFWYTNVDDEDVASTLGLCGGGVYREVQVYVDGWLAGTALPFPVIYTGGINPFLWRPLSGIMSFDIPALSFDLSPFVLGDGRAHSVTLRVEGGDSQGGVWYLDGTLLLERDPSAAPVDGGPWEIRDSGLDISVASGETRGAGLFWDTTSSRSLSVEGLLIKQGRLPDPDSPGKSVAETLFARVEVFVRGGNRDVDLEEGLRLVGLQGGSTAQGVVIQVKTALNFSIANSLEQHAEVQITDGKLQTLTLQREAPFSLLDAPSTGGLFDTVSSIVKSRVSPLSINSSYRQDATTFEIDASIRYGFHYRDSQPPQSGGASLVWANQVNSTAAYNRSLDHEVVYEEVGRANGSFAVYSSDSSSSAEDTMSGAASDKCGFRTNFANDGSILNDTSAYSCPLTGGCFVCGYELCYRYTDSSSSSITNLIEAASATVPSLVTLSGGSPGGRMGAFPVRHPLMGRTRLVALLNGGVP